MSRQVFPGHELRRRREELGLSVYEAFRHTRVPTRYIEALERGELDALPGHCYAAGFLKSYCIALGLQPERFVDSFRACSRLNAPRFLRRKKTLRVGRPPWLNDLFAWLVVMGIVVLGWVTYTVVFNPHANDADRAVDAGTMDIPNPAPPPSNF